MHRRMLVPLLALILLFGVFVTPSAAITGGQPDGEGHPYVALLLAPGETFCSGTLIAPRTILTAGHCTDFWSTIRADDGLESIHGLVRPTSVRW